MKDTNDPTRTPRRKNADGKTPAPATRAPSVDVSGGYRRDQQIDPRLPHERDETARNEAGERRGRIKQAHKDLATGQSDTDCRNSTEEKIEEKSGTTLRHKP